MKNDKEGYIKRKDVFEQLDRVKPIDGKDNSKERFRYIQWLSTYHAINSIEPVDVASVIHARWIKAHVLRGNKLFIKCSCCHQEYFHDYDDNVIMKYCPNCGSKMDLEE